jgi:hypothetical protein
MITDYANFIRRFKEKVGTSPKNTPNSIPSFHLLKTEKRPPKPLAGFDFLYPV